MLIAACAAVRRTLAFATQRGHIVIAPPDDRNLLRRDTSRRSDSGDVTEALKAAGYFVRLSAAGFAYETHLL
jgi:hypothetical protein